MKTRFEVLHFASGARRASAIATIALAIGLTSSQFGATQTVRQGGECPAQLPNEGKIGLGLVEGLVLFTGSNLDDRVNAYIKFRTELRFYSVAGSRVFVSIAVPEMGRNICGWADADYVLTDHGPLTVQEFGADNFATSSGPRNIKNPLYVKAMIRSAPQTAVETNTEYKAEDTPIFSRPYDDYDLDPSLKRPQKPIVAKARVFGIFYVYKQVTRERKKSAKPDEAPVRRWLFIGGSNPNDTNTMAGWIPSDDVFAWDNQLSLYYNERSNEQVDVFASLQALRTRDATKVLGSKPTPLRLPADRNIPRFPILGNARLTPEEVAYKIAYYGCWEQGCVAGDRKSGDQATFDLDQIAEFARNVRNVDILFVIDNTDSMSKYFRPIAQAVQQAAGTIAADRKGGIYRFAAAVYGDYRDTSVNPQNMDFRLFPFNSNPASLAQLLEVPTYGDVFGDNPEAGFAAIKRAVAEARWGAEAGYRIVFWIGDHGNRPVGQNERTSAADVRAALRAKQVAALIPINVAGKYNEKDNGNFIRQANEITQQQLPKDRREVLCCYAIQTHDEGKKVNDGEDAGRRVRNFVEYIFQVSRELPEWIKAQRAQPETGDQPLSGRSQASDLPLVELREAALRARNLSSEAVKLVYQTKSLMTDGFVRYNEKRKALDFWVVIQEKDLHLLNYVAKSLCSALRGTDPRSAVDSTFKQLTSVTSGDPFDPAKEQLSEFLQRILFLPKEHFSELLSMKLDEFSRWWGENAAQKKGQDLRANVCRSQFLLDKVSQKERVDLDGLTLLDARSGSWGTKDGIKPRTFKWLWELENGFEVYYLPANYLPGSRD